MKKYTELLKEKSDKIMPPKSKQVCETCKHWYKYHGNCASGGGRCACGMYYPIYVKKS